MVMAPRKAENPKRTAKYYRDHPEAREKKAEMDKKFNAKPEQKEKRRELSEERRKRGIMGKGGDDLSHTKDGGLVKEDPSKNRARNRGKK
jgi:hypothetical protein